MALQAAYKQFLDAPSPDHLASDASLHYVTTLTTHNSSAEIIKHLKSQTRLLKKKEEKFLDAVEAPNALAVEVETTIEFVLAGGAYLPGLDDNFLADRTVTFPVIHIVSFDGHGKVQQVRQNWDQGSLLKLIDVIGKTGRNWPIRDGKDQIKLIVNSVKNGGNHTTTNGEADPRDALARNRGNSTNVTRDPHASLSLFAPREQVIEESESIPHAVAPRASAKPPPRDYHDLFAGNDSDHSPVTDSFKNSENRERSESPSKTVKAKSGAGKNYRPSRLFDTDENSPETKPVQEKMYRPNPAKYQHFDFADQPTSPVAPAPPKDTKKSKHASQWNFDDFVTPEKAVPTKGMVVRNARHWGNSEDEVEESPVRKEKVDKPRKDAQTHFEFVDEGTPVNEKRMIGRPRGTGLDNGMGLYRNNVYDEEETQGADSAPAGNGALKTVTNVKDRRKDFDAHFEMRDDSPVTKNFPGNTTYNAASTAANQKENINTLSAGNENKPAPLGLREDNKIKKETGIVIGGDGMGGKKGAGRSWGFGDDSDGEEAGGLNGVGGSYRKGMAGGGKKMGGTSQQTGGGDFWDF